MIQSILLTTKYEALDLELPDKHQLPALYENIGCRNVEVVTFMVFDIQFDMWCDGEALFQAHPVHNMVASVMAERPIHGNVIITGKPDADGEITDIDPNVAAFLRYACLHVPEMTT